MPRPCRTCPATASGWQLDGILAPFAYAPPLSRYIQALKYQRVRWLGRYLGDLLAAEIDPRRARIDAVVPVPLHPRRLRWRTFNQADELAERVAALLRVRLLISGIRRRRDTKPQTERGRLDRIKLDQGTFEIGLNLEGLRLALVDDVATTGATLNALAGALRGAGASHIEAWVLTRSIG